VKKDELILRGLPISKGIGIGAPLFYAQAGREIIDVSIHEREVEREVQRYRQALHRSRRDVEDLQKLSLAEGPSEVVAILDVHLELLRDPLITTAIEEKIRTQQRNTESIFHRAVEQYKERFSAVEDRYFQERLRDIDDISRRVLHYLIPPQRRATVQQPQNAIVLAHELAPSETVEAITSSMHGLVTMIGGVTSHVAIIARAQGIPYVANIDIRQLRQMEISSLIVDGSQGLLILNPEPDTLKKYQRLKRGQARSYRLLKNASHLKAETIDGYQVDVLANLENPREVEFALKQGASGVGLFRSEYLYLTKGVFPTEEEQLTVYKRMIQKLAGRPLTIRVFDVGGDKCAAPSTRRPDDYFAQIGPELNPALGCRAIRLLLRFPELLETQLRAIVRASQYGPIQILLPMISDLSEFHEVRKLLRSIQKHGPPIPLGCMIEVPSIALLADSLSEEVDFLSIGTNDLIQYVLAADRNNPLVNELYTPVHPSVLRLIRFVVTSAEKCNKPLVLCGESAADPMMIPLLLGLGVREFSVAARHLPLVKHVIRKWRIVEACCFAEQALACGSAQELKRLLEERGGRGE
jgi:phosphotransferase system enzyme I (PtsI)